MIGRLRGVVAEVGEEEALIDVGGVGYVVRCGARTLSRLALEAEALLHVETQWAEATGMRLYGFVAREERATFVALQAIQGVGPKAALGVLDVLSPRDLAAAAARGDKAAVARANGVGPKLALRIVTELKDKPLGAGIAIGPLQPAVSGEASSPAPVSAMGETTAALMGLGVAEAPARRAAEAAIGRLGDEAGEAALIKSALQELGR